MDWESFKREAVKANENMIEDVLASIEKEAESGKEYYAVADLYVLGMEATLEEIRERAYKKYQESERGTTQRGSLAD